MLNDNSFSDSFMGMLIGDYSKLAKQALEKELEENNSKFLLLGLIDKLVELKIISEKDIHKIKLKGKSLYLNILKESLSKKYDNIDEDLSKMNEDFCKNYIKEINKELNNIKIEGSK